MVGNRYIFEVWLIACGAGWQATYNLWLFFVCWSISKVFESIWFFEDYWSVHELNIWSDKIIEEVNFIWKDWSLVGFFHKFCGKILVFILFRYLFLLQVEGKPSNSVCYYLYENLKENEEDTFSHSVDEKQEDIYDVPFALPGNLGHSCGECSSSQISLCNQVALFLDKICSLANLFSSQFWVLFVCWLTQC